VCAGGSSEGSTKLKHGTKLGRTLCYILSHHISKDEKLSRDVPLRGGVGRGGRLRLERQRAVDDAELVLGSYCLPSPHLYQRSTGHTHIHRQRTTPPTTTHTHTHTTRTTPQTNTSHKHLITAPVRGRWHTLASASSHPR